MVLLIHGILHLCGYDRGRSEREGEECIGASRPCSARLDESEGCGVRRFRSGMMHGLTVWACSVGQRDHEVSSGLVSKLSEGLSKHAMR